MEALRSLTRVLVTAALFLPNLHAAEVRVDAAIPGSLPEVLFVEARRLDQETLPIAREIAAGEAERFDLPEGTWQVRIRDDRVWAAPATVRSRDSVTLRAWPASRLTGTMNAVSELRLEVSSREPEGPSGEAECAIEGKSWTCVVPVAVLDLRFVARGCAPEHRFDVRIAASRMTLEGPVHFTAGASLFGTVEIARGARGSVEGVQLQLTPAGSQGGRSLTTTATARGFFQFKGLAPGAYTLRATRDGLAALARDVRILEGATARLQKPLLLDVPRRLTVMITPPSDVEGRPWRVRLLSVDTASRRSETISESAASSFGQWEHGRLTAGDYEVEVRRGTGEIWKAERFAMEGEDVMLPLSAFSVGLSGRVTLGDRPLAATLTFGGEGGVTLESDESGAFAGEVPPGSGERTVLIRAETPTVRRTIRATPSAGQSGGLRLDLRLPDTTLIGRVLRHDRSPAKDTVITVTGAGTFEQAFTNASGEFQIAGLEPGRHRILADDFESQSIPAWVDLESDAVSEVELTLQPVVRARGRMLMRGTPVIAARIYALPRDGWAPTVPSARTDERGHFVLTLPPGTTTYDVVAIHPAFEVVLGRVVHDPKKIVTVSAQQIGGTLTVETTSPEDLLLRHGGGEYQFAWLARESGGIVEKEHASIPSLQAGDYTLCSRTSGKCTSGYVQAHGSTTIRFR